jgi:hypothetical protein
MDGISRLGRGGRQWKSVEAGVVNVAGKEGPVMEEGGPQ